MPAPAGRSLNREARRYFESLRTPGRPPEHLMEVVSVRRADGREVSLSEIPLEQTLNTGEAVRAEEVVLSVPDGRSVRTLINAAPIRVEEDEIDSVVMTTQDLAPPDKIERMRTEFLGLVDHELRAPLIAIKGSADALLKEADELDPAEMREFFRIIAEQAGHMRGLIRDLLDAGRIDSGTLSVTTEPSEVAALVERARSTFLSGGGRHAVLVALPAGLPPVMADHRRIVQVLNNLFANAARHAPESTPIRVAAVREDALFAVSVSDEGSGVAPELLPHLFSKHSGGRPGATAGHGLGLAISKGLVEAHGGRIRAGSPGGGRSRGRRGARPGTRRAAAHPGDRRRPAGAALRPRRALRGRLRPAGDGRAAGAAAHHLDREAPAGAARPDAARRRPHRADGAGPRAGRRAGHLISGYGRDEIVAKALEAGAADYLVKPFSPTELVARIQAALRRPEEPEPFAVGDLAIDYPHRRVTVAARRST